VVGWVPFIQFFNLKSTAARQRKMTYRYVPVPVAWFPVVDACTPPRLSAIFRELVRSNHISIEEDRKLGGIIEINAEELLG
jgi:hypothetical protein